MGELIEGDNLVVGGQHLHGGLVHVGDGILADQPIDKETQHWRFAADSDVAGKHSPHASGILVLNHEIRVITVGGRDAKRGAGAKAHIAAALHEQRIILERLGIGVCHRHFVVVAKQNLRPYKATHLASVAGGQTIHHYFLIIRHIHLHIISTRGDILGEDAGGITVLNGKQNIGDVLVRKLMAGHIGGHGAPSETQGVVARPHHGETGGG